MQIPKRLPPNDGKRFWSDNDSFPPDTPRVRVFLHRNYQIGMHAHEFHEVNIVVQGKGYHYIGNMCIPLHVGDVFVIPPNTEHGYVCEQDLNVFHILIQSEFFRRYGKDLQETPGYATMFEIEPFLRGVHGTPFFLQLDFGTLQETEHRLHRIAQNTTPSVQHTSVLALLCELCLRMHENQQQSKENEHEIFRAMTYLREHADEKTEIQTLLQLTHMSQATFHRHFRKISHMSPIEYKLQCRMDLVRRLLAEGQLNKTEIAHRCGFYDVAHMDKYLQ